MVPSASRDGDRVSLRFFVDLELLRVRDRFFLDFSTDLDLFRSLDPDLFRPRDPDRFLSLDRLRSLDLDLLRSLDLDRFRSLDLDLLRSLETESFRSLDTELLRSLESFRSFDTELLRRSLEDSEFLRSLETESDTFLSLVCGCWDVDGSSFDFDRFRSVDLDCFRSFEGGGLLDEDLLPDFFFLGASGDSEPFPPPDLNLFRLELRFFDPDRLRSRPRESERLRRPRESERLRRPPRESDRFRELDRLRLLESLRPLEDDRLRPRDADLRLRRREFERLRLRDRDFLRFEVERLRLRDRFLRSAGDRSDFFRPAERDRLREVDRSSFFLSLLTDRFPFFTTEPSRSPDECRDFLRSPLERRLFFTLERDLDLDRPIV